MGMAAKQAEAIRADGTIPAKTVAAVAAALGMHLQNERIRFRILNITRIPSSDLNLWGVTGRVDAMRPARRGRW